MPFPGLLRSIRTSLSRGGKGLLLAFLAVPSILQAQTTLTTGDIAIVGVSACPGSNDDQVSFFCFKDILTGTTIDLTDNGYERNVGAGCAPQQPAGTFGNTEGTVRMTRTGGMIPAGRVITFNMTNTPLLSSTAPDAAWSCVELNFDAQNYQIELNNNGDQLIFMQGGAWSQGTINQHNATYTGGRYLAGISTNSANPWTATCTSNGPRQSNAPPGIGCLALRVNSATAYDKYIGPITAATQRDWQLRIADPANWQSYNSCTNYNAAGQNWLASPTLSILPSTPTTGLWTGAKSTDWFNVCNWDDLSVPTSSTNVLINHTSPVDPTIGISPLVPTPTGAACNTLTIRSNDGEKVLTLKDAKTLNVTGLTWVERLTNGSPCGIYIQNTSTFNSGGLQLTGFTTGSGDAFFNNTWATTTATINGNLRIEDGGQLALNGGTLTLKGDYTNLNSEARFDDANSTVKFTGTGAQSINTSGFEEFFNVVQVNKPSGDLTLNNGIRIRSNLDLLNGRIFENSSLLVLNATATATGMSNASFVHGPVQKYGTADFTFPIGKGSTYRPAGLNGIVGLSTDAFTAEYFTGNPRAIYGNSRDITLDHISACEYWILGRSAGSANATVNLSWDTPASCGVTQVSSLRIARWSGSSWIDRGNTGATGSIATGNTNTSAVQTSFSPWTLASINSQNPLPIQLLSFTAVPREGGVALQWSTATESNNAFFTVERSDDGDTWTDVLQQDGAGNSQGVIHYEDLDRSPLMGLSYYRLRQTDTDGTSTVSDAVPVYIGRDAGAPLIVLYDGDALYAMHGFSTGATLHVLDATGRVLRSEAITTSGLTPLPVDGLPPGAYILRLTDGVRMQGTRFVR